jgi:hypothetical protein
MPGDPFNKYRTAIEILQRGRDILVEGLADEVLDRGEELVEGGFALNEFLEAQGTRLHFLCLLVSQLEQSAEALDEASRPSPPAASAPAAKKPAAKRRPRAKKLAQQISGKGSGDEH